jgi:succinyl-CoA synthetase beta subunit
VNIHEYQAKELLGAMTSPCQTAAWHSPRRGCAGRTQAGRPHLGGEVADPRRWTRRGRFAGDPSGKGGVRVVKSIDEVQANAAQMLGATLVTKQTGPAGREVRRLYIEEGCDIARELYLAC